MNSDEQSRLQDFIERYETGQIPWDHELPPPELMTFVADEETGRALDLGCGFGRSSIYLALHGWEVDGVDFVPRAVEIAREKALKAGLGEQVRFYVSSVTELDFLKGHYDFVVDIGCMHSLPWSELIIYHNNLLRLLHAGGIYLLFAHLRNEKDVDDEEIRWIENESLLALFSKGFELEHVEYGVTQVEDKPPWKSAWFRFRRLDQ